jgi:hypothetical protein
MSNIGVIERYKRIKSLKNTLQIFVVPNNKKYEIEIKMTCTKTI